MDCVKVMKCLEAIKNNLILCIYSPFSLRVYIKDIY